MRSPVAEVVIIGAGIGGLTAALSLARRGIPVAVYEQAPALGEVGAGVQIGPNATKVLDSLGLMPALEKLAFHPARKEVRIWNTAERFSALDLSAEALARHGAPYLTLHRADLHATLLEALREVAPQAVRTGHRLVSLAQDERGVRAAFENGAQAEAAILVGADGIHSAVRQCLFGDGDATYSGLLSWRGLVPMERLPPELSAPVATNWVGPNGHIVHYPLRGGSVMNINAVVEHPTWPGRQSWNMPGRIADCLRDFTGWHADVRYLLSRIDTPLQWALLHREPLERWTEGRVTLLGDACHSMVPFLAQGASQAIEDGLVLARAIAARRDDAQGALAAYEQVRKPRAYRVVEGSRENTARFHNPRLRDPADAVAYVTETWGGNKLGGGLDWIFCHDPRTVPV